MPMSNMPFMLKQGVCIFVRLYYQFILSTHYRYFKIFTKGRGARSGGLEQRYGGGREHEEAIGRVLL